MIDQVNVNSAFASGLQGFQRASNGVAEASASIAQRTAQSPVQTQAGSGEVSSVQGQNATGDLTSDLISLEVNSLNAQASARVIEVANETVGTIIDTTA